MRANQITSGYTKSERTRLDLELWRACLGWAACLPEERPKSTIDTLGFPRLGHNKKRVEEDQNLDLSSSHLAR